jgi:hypothetical protein
MDQQLGSRPGAYVLSEGPYGTFDQAGNVYELTEVFHNAPGARGGSWLEGGSSGSHASSGARTAPIFETNQTGFRVATIVPEPGVVSLSSLAVIGLWRRKRLM